MIALLVLLLLFGITGWYWIRSLPPPQRRPALIKLGVAAAIAVIAILALSGRFYLVLGLLAGLLPFLKRLLPGLVLGRVLRGGIPGGGGRKTKPQPGNQSRVTSDILDMTLDHDSGDMTGRVLKGPFAGQSLADLGEAQFIELLRYCRGNDDDSARLLESYLDRRFGDSWREDDPDQAGSEHAEEQGAAPDRSRPLTEHEALEILGLEPGATRDEIIQAHRQLMQKMHPDRGGSTYLASLINEAKAALVD